MSDRKKIPAIVTEAGNGNSVETHPSFGMISLSRYTSSGGRSYFGAAVEPHAGVSISIHKGEKHRSMSNTWYHAREEVIQVDMSEAQFAQMITSFNIGGGVPCTISHISKSALATLPDGIIPECPEISERKKVETEFKHVMRNLGEEVAKLVLKAQQLQEKPSVNKGDRQEFVKIADGIASIIRSQVPFVQSQFNEAMDATVAHAKSDVDAFISNLMRQAGVEAMRDKVLAAKPNLLPIEDAQVVEEPRQLNG